MSKKRRVFDIDLPQDDTPESFPTGKVEEKERRGPMAAAITENADSLRERQRLEAEIRAENDQLAHEHVRLQSLGLIVDRVPLDQIKMSKITRDRAVAEDAELVELVESIRSVGLSNPILVERGGDGALELVQGYRRIAAFEALMADTDDANAYGAIPARVVNAGDDLETLHRRMVDENLVRKDISFAEMAQLAINYAADPGIELSDPDKAVAVLYKSTGYSKRSYIRAFIKLMDALGSELKFSQDIPRALGLKVVRMLEEVEGCKAALLLDLADLGAARTSEQEVGVLRRYVGALEEDGVPAEPSVGSAEKVEKDTRSKAKVTFQIRRPEGTAKCTAGSGRLEIRLRRDFSTIDRRRLEDAVAAMLNELD